MHVNFDQISALRRFGALVSAGTRVGLRVDPMVRVGYGENARTDYSGGKLGLAPEDLNAALAAARHAGLVVDTLHMHLGWGLRDRDEAAFREGLAILAAAAKRIDSLEVRKCRRRPRWQAARNGYSPFAGAVGGSDPRRVPGRGEREWPADCLRARHLYRGIRRHPSYPGYHRFGQARRTLDRP